MRNNAKRRIRGYLRLVSYISHSSCKNITNISIIHGSVNLNLFLFQLSWLYDMDMQLFRLQHFIQHVIQCCNAHTRNVPWQMKGIFIFVDILHDCSTKCHFQRVRTFGFM